MHWLTTPRHSRLDVIVLLTFMAVVTRHGPSLPALVILAACAACSLLATRRYGQPRS